MPSSLNSATCFLSHFDKTSFTSSLLPKCLPQRWCFRIQLKKQEKVNQCKIRAVREMIKDIPSKGVNSWDQVLGPSSSVRHGVVAENQDSCCQHAAASVLDCSSELSQYTSAFMVTLFHRLLFPLSFNVRYTYVLPPVTI